VLNVCGTNIRIQGNLVRIASLADEGFEFLEDPLTVLSQLRGSRKGIDIFTFMQRLPQTTPMYDYPLEWDNVAALSISTFENWFTKQIDGKTRNMVRRAEKKGIVVREVPFDDALVQGIWEIYNECPVRQGRRFPHYGKDLDAVHKMSASFMDCSFFVGALLDGKLIGFVKLTTNEANSQATVMHIIAMVQHRDKAPTNALLSESVQACAKRGLPYMVYSHFAYGKKQRDTLSDFKENNGFKRIDLPRYYVPLTAVGRLALRLGLHHSFMERVPESLLAKLRDLRNEWYKRKVQSAAEAS
jgi:hypothetical protein